MKKKILFTLFIANLTIGLFAVTINVTSTDPAVLQATINASNVGDEIIVADGTITLSTYIYINKGITLRSLNGSAMSIIDGNNTTRCFYISHPDAIVDGFTIQHARGNTVDKHGGGVRLANGGTVQNCIIKDNYGQDGGGVAIDASGGFILNCVVRNNRAVWGGGIRLFGGEVRNCLITENTGTSYGGGINIYTAGDVYNCTITKNASPSGGGIRLWKVSNIENCIIDNNTLTDLSTINNFIIAGTGNSFKNCCSTPNLPTSISTDCITVDPSFVGSGDYHLNLGSGCINTGLNKSWMTGTYDLDSNNRIYYSVVDMGCYEYITPIIDDDGDGVENHEDDFPNDPDRAFLNHTPTNGYGSLAFEDLWPGRGDYDFNDVVVDYRFAIVTNAQNYVVDVTATFIAKASGAHFHNGFGFNLPNANSNLISNLTVTGYDLQESYINIGGNGLELNQSHPTIIVFDDIFNLLIHPEVGLGVNTEDWTPFVPFHTMELTLTPTQNMFDIDDFALVDWNPFIIVNLDRNVEVHLINKPPTDLADPSIFGTVEDDSDPGSGRYYVTTNNLPWAIEVPSSFDWPKEKIEISQAYHYFIEWAESLGGDYDDWYLDLPGNRNSSYIYDVPTP